MSDDREPNHIHTTPSDWSEPGERATHSVGDYVHEKSESGHEARDRTYDRMQGAGPVLRVIAFIGGILCIIVGIPMLICPGPGLLVLGVGIGLVCAAVGRRPSSGKDTGGSS